MDKFNFGNRINEFSEDERFDDMERFATERRGVTAEGCDCWLV